MFKNLKKKLFRRSVQKLFIGSSALFTLSRHGVGAQPYVEGQTYTAVSQWENNAALTVLSPNYTHGTLQIVNQAFADGHNKYEAAALIVCRLIAVDTEHDESEEYARLYGLFQDSPRVIHKKLEKLSVQGEIRTVIKDAIASAFATLYNKYPEFKQEAPPEPVEIFWWELGYNDSKTNQHRIQGCFETVQEVVDYISGKERTDELFWEYPKHNTPRKWEPTAPPVSGYEEKRIFAMPHRAWDVFWDKCDGILTGSNFDHWEALKKSSFVRPTEQKFALHRVLDRPYQKEMFG